MLVNDIQVEIFPYTASLSMLLLARFHQNSQAALAAVSIN